MKKFKGLFPHKGSVIAVVHVDALPGTPVYSGNDAANLERTLAETAIYCAAGVDGIILENMHDTPYLNRKVGHEISAMMSMLAYEVKKQSKLPCGVQILAGANKAALAVAKAARLDFIRAEGFVFAHTADEGIIQSDAGELLRYRKMIEAEEILVFTDIKKKHSSHAITSDVDLGATAEAAEFFQSDGLIVTGDATGQAARVEDLEMVKKKSSLPLIVGSGMNPENLSLLMPFCDAFIVGSYFKKDAHWANALEADRVKRFMEAVGEMR